MVKRSKEEIVTEAERYVLGCMASHVYAAADFDGLAADDFVNEERRMLFRNAVPHLGGMILLGHFLGQDPTRGMVNELSVILRGGYNHGRLDTSIMTVKHYALNRRISSLAKSEEPATAHEIDCSCRRLASVGMDLVRGAAFNLATGKGKKLDDRIMMTALSRGVVRLEPRESAKVARRLQPPGEIGEACITWDEWAIGTQEIER